MGELIERLLKRDDAGNGVDAPIPVHTFSSICGQVARNRINSARANEMIGELTGKPLTTGPGSGGAEATAILNWIMGPAGVAAKIARRDEINDVFFLARSGATEWNTPAKVKAHLITLGVLL